MAVQDRFSQGRGEFLIDSRPHHRAVQRCQGRMIFFRGRKFLTRPITSIGAERAVNYPHKKNEKQKKKKKEKKLPSDTGLGSGGNKIRIFKGVYVQCGRFLMMRNSTAQFFARLRQNFLPDLLRFLALGRGRPPPVPRSVLPHAH